MNIEKLLAFLWFFSLPICNEMTASIQLPNKVFDTIVIDAGHGGKDGGCQGKYSAEKHVALAIALKLGKRIEEEMPGVKVIYTRDKDVFIPLDDRAKIANENNADLFICIHCNAVITNKEAIAGTETYTMGMHVKESNLAVASRENGVIAYEDNYEKKYDGYDPNSTEGYILLSMYQSAYIQQSLDFATRVESQFAKIGRKSRGVFQAGFLVLRKTAMPSVLIETGYLTNSKEEGYLSSEDGKTSIANSIFEAVKSYKRDIEKISPSVSAKESIVGKKDTTQKTVATTTKKTTETTPPANTPKPQPEPRNPAVKVSNVTKSTPTVDAVPKASPKSPPATQTEGVKKSGIKVSEPKIDNEPITFSVCLLSSPTQQDTTTVKWKKAGAIIVKKNNGRFEYYTNNRSDYYAVRKQEGVLKENGFPQAFIKAYKGGLPINLVDAKEKLGIND